MGFGDVTRERSEGAGEPAVVMELCRNEQMSKISFPPAHSPNLPYYFHFRLDKKKKKKRFIMFVVHRFKPREVKPTGVNITAT